MKKCVFILIIVSSFCFSQEVKETPIPHTSKIAKEKITQYEKELNERLSAAKKTGNELTVKRIERELYQFYNKNKTYKNNVNERQWETDSTTKTELVDNISFRDYKETLWNDDIYIASSSSNENAISIACRENGDLYAVYEDYGYSKTRLHIKKVLT